MEGLKLSIPQRLNFLRIIITLGLFFSFFLSFNLWGNDHYFPALPVIHGLDIPHPLEYVFLLLSCFFLLGSVVFNRTRLFIFLSLLVNISMVLFDVNRLQPWFYIYNSILVVFLFYNGRVDNPNSFTSIFIFIQLIIASVYVYNGMSQLLNPLFVITDFYDIVLPLKKVISDRQFLFVLKMGKTVPLIPVFIGIGLLIRPVKYLAISLALVMHLMLFILLFPSTGNNNFALWFMNLVFGIAIFLLFSGETRQRYFSPFVLLQKPVFYFVLAVFWIMPAFSGGLWPAELSFSFKSGASAKQNMYLTTADYTNLPYYVKAFCVKESSGYILKVSSWCGHELRSEYFNHDFIVNDGFKNAMQLVTAAPPLTTGELSAR